MNKAKNKIATWHGKCVVPKLISDDSTDLNDIITLGLYQDSPDEIVQYLYIDLPKKLF